MNHHWLTLFVGCVACATATAEAPDGGSVQATNDGGNSARDGQSSLDGRASSSDAEPSEDGGRTDGSRPPAEAGSRDTGTRETGPASCVSIVNGGADIPEVQVASDPPAATGGVPSLGTYYLTAATLYTGVGGATGNTGKTRKETISGSIGSFEAIEEMTGAAPYAYSGTYSLGGQNDVAYSVTCPSPGNVNVPFSASGTSFKLYRQVSGKTIELAYELQ